MSGELVGILLAAGASTRFGADKLRQPLPGGLWLAQQACRILVAGVGRVVAVVRAEDELSERLRGEGTEVVICPEAAAGMGVSLAHGVRHTAEAGAWLIALADMPWIRPVTIRQLADALRGGAPLVAPSYRDQRGHPVGFSHRFGPELAALRGDQGAKSILNVHGQALRLIACDDPGVLHDVDQPGDLQPPVCLDDERCVKAERSRPR